MPENAAPPSDDAVTLGTIRDLVARSLRLLAEVPHGNTSSSGYKAAMTDVKAILDMHGAPPDQPVVYPHG